MLVKIVREEVEIPVVIDKAAVDAAVIQVPHSVERLRVGHRKRFQQNRVYQRENRRVRPDSQRNRENDGHGKGGRLAKLTERDEDLMHEMPPEVPDLLGNYAGALQIVQLMHSMDTEIGGNSVASGLT